MYTDPLQWKRIRDSIQSGKRSIRATSRDTGLSRKTIRKMLKYELPPPYGGLPQAELPSTVGSRFWEDLYDIVVAVDRGRAVELLESLSLARSPILSSARARKVVLSVVKGHEPTPREKRRDERIEWIRSVERKRIEPPAWFRDKPILMQKLASGRPTERNRVLTVLAKEEGITGRVICDSLGISRNSVRRYFRAYQNGGEEALFARQRRAHSKSEDQGLKDAVFKTLHEPPSQYGINRTSWTMAHLSSVLRDKGHAACYQVLRTIIKSAGYQWRKARVALTSTDPEYSEKLSKVRAILSELKEDEAFFSIDEFGPFAVKMKPGRMLVPPGEQRIVPQWQKSRGCLILTAALELSGNQVTHFYSTRKNTDEMIRMMDLLLSRYHQRRKLYLSWDAASWHMSKKLQKRIDEHNEQAAALGQPLIALAPLPAGAQFLNVIESVFSGMSRAIIHNSDYPSTDAAKAAIDRYFASRNRQFQLNPRRAGRRIWGKEREPASFSTSHNCKDPRFR